MIPNLKIYLSKMWERGNPVVVQDGELYAIWDTIELEIRPKGGTGQSTIRLLYSGELVGVCEIGSDVILGDTITLSGLEGRIRLNISEA